MDYGTNTLVAELVNRWYMYIVHCTGTLYSAFVSYYSFRTASFPSPPTSYFHYCYKISILLLGAQKNFIYIYTLLISKLSAVLSKWCVYCVRLSKPFKARSIFCIGTIGIVHHITVDRPEYFQLQLIIRYELLELLCMYVTDAIQWRTFILKKNQDNKIGQDSREVLLLTQR